MIEITKFITRIFITALTYAAVATLIFTFTYYLFDMANGANSKEVFMSGNIAVTLYEVLRLILKFMLSTLITAIILTILMGYAEFIAAAWRTTRFQPKHLNKIQNEIIVSKLNFDELFEVCEDAIINQQAKIVKTDVRKGIIKAMLRSKLTGVSEEMTVLIRRDGKVSILSKTVNNFASLHGTSTFGRNVKNVESIADYIAKHSHGTLPSRSGVDRIKLFAVILGIGLLCFAVIVLAMTVGLVGNEAVLNS